MTDDSYRHHRLQGLSGTGTGRGLCGASAGGLIERRGWRFLHSYIDRGMSGASPFRVGYQKLLEDARAGVFDVVVAEALDRLSRD